MIAAEELNFCVRNENRCFLLAMGTEGGGLKRLVPHILAWWAKPLSSMSKYQHEIELLIDWRLFEKHQLLVKSTLSVMFMQA